MISAYTVNKRLYQFSILPSNSSRFTTLGSFHFHIIYRNDNKEGEMMKQNPKLTQMLVRRLLKKHGIDYKSVDLSDEEKEQLREVIKEIEENVDNFLKKQYTTTQIENNEATGK